MSPQQRKILKGTMAAVIAALLFPPFISPTGSGVMQGAGFGFLLSWPERSMVHVELLVAEWLAICMVSGILWAQARDPKMPSFLGSILGILRSRSDVHMEVARIHADATIRAAEITASRSAQMDLLDHYK